MAAALPKTMRAVRKLHEGPGFDLVEIPVPRPKEGEVLLKVLACSLCGTDVHVHNWDAPWSEGRFKPPVTTGHEVCAEVVELGPGDTCGLAVGDNVSAESHIWCGECRSCQLGNYHICENIKFFSIDVDGFFAEYAVAPAKNLWKNPPGMPAEIASLQESLGNSVYTVEESHVKGKFVAIFGLGPTGLNAIAVAKAMGARLVLAVGGSSRHMELAVQMGADLVIDRHTVDAAAKIRELTGGLGVHVALEMSGSVDALRACLDSVMTTGQVTILGLYSTNEVPLDVSRAIVLRDITLRGIYGRRVWRTWETMARLLSKEGGLDISPVITHRLPLERWEEGIAAMKKGECGKVVFFPHGVPTV